VADFAAQTFLKPFRRSKRALIFNIVITTLAGVAVFLTDWQSGAKST
jgi:hypothetical protein